MERRRARSQAQIEWFGNQVAQNIRVGMAARLRVAAQLLRDRVVINLSKPVEKTRGQRSGRTRVVPGSRSRPGEFPRADTTRLMKDIFYEVDGMTARVGTTLDYGLILETQMDRSFLQRTMNELRPVLERLLIQGSGGGRTSVRFR